MVEQLIQTPIMSTLLYREKLDKITSVLKSLANEKRIDILILLDTQSPMDFQYIKDSLQISKTALANHLNILEKELLNDPKECAEHLMLIDLGRNDVGRIAQIGTVQLTENMNVERYSHVMHIVSNVIGQLKRDLNSIDVLKATFPAGTLTGAPKIRAMEIINELEPIKRGIYGGAIGYMTWQGNMDTAIAIRTAVIKNQKLHIQVGAGIVADSVPAKEWEETMNKGRAIFKAVALAHKGL